MTLSIPLSAEEQAALLAQAQAQGVSVDALLRQAVLQVISAAKKPEVPAPLNAEEFDRAFEEISDMIPAGIPPLAEEALTRESIYTREDEWSGPRR